MAGLTGEEAYILARKYTQNTVMGGGAVVGKNVVVKKIAPIDGGNRVTFGYTLDDGTEKESTLDVMDGVSPDIKENDGNTSDTYKLDIIDKNGTITTPNLKGEKGNQGEQGLRGEPGQRGERGEQGLQGVPGPQGIQGERGERGKDGYPFLIYKEYSDISEFQDADFPEIGLMFMVKDEDDPEGYPVYRFLGEEAEGDHYSLITRLGKSQAIKGDKGEPGERGERGEQGLPGEPGRDGVDGKDGTTYTPAIGNVTTGQSAAASVDIDEDKKIAKFNFTLPDGDTVIDDVKVNGQSLPIAEDKSVNVIVPTKVSDLDNDADYETKAEVTKQLEEYATTAAVDEKLGDYAMSSDVETELKKYALVTEAGYDLGLNIDSTTYKMTLELKNKAGTVLVTREVEFPLESMVIGAEYADGQLTLKLQNGTTLDPIDISDIVGGLVKESFTIAGIDMRDNIEASELITALGIDDKVGKTDDTATNKVTFTESAERENIASGDTHATLFGKIKKWFSDLKKVAFSGSYNDLSDTPTLFSGSYNDLEDKPTIPAAAKNGKLTIQKNGTTVATFTADQSTDQTANIEVPTYGNASASAAGIAKLYTATGQGTDGSMTQKAITDALNGKVNKSGDTMTGALTVNGATVTGNGSDNSYKGTFTGGQVNIGAKVRITTNNEGGNIRIESPSGGHHYEMDAFNGNLRLYHGTSASEVVHTITFNTSGQLSAPSFVGPLSGNATTATTATTANNVAASNRLTTRAQVEATTAAGKVTDAMAVKEISKGLGIRIRNSNGTPQWAPWGADTWSPFNSGKTLEMWVSNGSSSGTPAAIACFPLASVKEINVLETDADYTTYQVTIFTNDANVVKSGTGHNIYLYYFNGKNTAGKSYADKDIINKNLVADCSSKASTYKYITVMRSGLNDSAIKWMRLKITLK